MTTPLGAFYYWCHMTILQRFMKKFEIKGSGCWEWIGEKSVGGYGRMWVDGLRVGAHRISWEIHNGKIPKGLLVCHKCDNTKCVNPNHLFIGTHQDNSNDMLSKGRQAKSKLSNDDVNEMINLKSKGLRQCDIAEIYNVHRSTISRALRRE